MVSANLAAEMATARMMSAASNTSASCLPHKRPFFSLSQKVPNFNSLCFNNTTRRVSKRLFSCKSIYNPDVRIKEEGHPETLDYRVYFLDSSGKKVVTFTLYLLKSFSFLCNLFCLVIKWEEWKWFAKPRRKLFGKLIPVSNDIDFSVYPCLNLCLFRKIRIHCFR